MTDIDLFVLVLFFWFFVAAGFLFYKVALIGLIPLALLSFVVISISACGCATYAFIRTSE